ncbi:MAG TPA: tRNA (guanosine(46)-N7)-methyltransferase TrmB [Bacillales bacterium]|nr:tRNA (guanosine(46)-N7)-methyltransferase TrmB [Bacillales bacterium]
MRLRHKPWAKDKIMEYRDIVIPNPQKYAGKWALSFQNGAPLHLEIGTGKGRFLAESAKQFPDVLFIGMEKMESIIVSALDKVLEAEVENAKLLHEDARELPMFFAEGEVDRIYLNFSDPWPKNRHEKRRLTHANFLKQYESVLKPEGEIHLKTDNRGFFQYSLESFQEYGLAVKNISWDLHKSAMKDNVMTEYEQRFSEKGQPIYRCEAHF